MFIVRSAFWLSAAFLLMAPSAGMDIGASARATGEELVSQSTGAVIGQLSALSCDSVECNLGRSLVVSALPPIPAPAAETVPASTESRTAPFPPHRPQWAY